MKTSAFEEEHLRYFGIWAGRSTRNAPLSVLSFRGTLGGICYSYEQFKKYIHIFEKRKQQQQQEQQQ